MQVKFFLGYIRTTALMMTVMSFPAERCVTVGRYPAPQGGALHIGCYPTLEYVRPTAFVVEAVSYYTGCYPTHRVLPYFSVCKAYGLRGRGREFLHRVLPYS